MPMHELYEDILATYYSHLAARSRKRVTEFYNTLPPPEEITKQWILKRLGGLAIGSRSVYIAWFRPICERLKIDISDLKSRASKSHVKRSDLYTKEEIEQLLTKCGSTRDRAIIATLYESAFRAFELLNIKFEDIRVDQQLWWISVKGKRGLVREVPIRMAIPALQSWLDVHPLGKGFVFTWEKVPFYQLQYHGLLEVVRRAARNADIRIRRAPVHLFRHTRLTELATQLREAELRVFAGWEPGSAMPRIYVHLASEDLDKSFRKIHGLPIDEKEAVPKLEAIACPRCGRMNIQGARFCSTCSLVLDEKLALVMSKDKRMREEVAKNLLTGRISPDEIRRMVQEEIRLALGLPIHSSVDEKI